MACFILILYSNQLHFYATKTSEFAFHMHNFFFKLTNYTEWLSKIHLNCFLKASSPWFFEVLSLDQEQSLVFYMFESFTQGRKHKKGLSVTLDASDASQQPVHGQNTRQLSGYQQSEMFSSKTIRIISVLFPPSWQKDVSRWSCKGHW